MTPDREEVVSHMQIMHTWASFALEHGINFFEMEHIKRIAEWTEDALALLKEQEPVEPVTRSMPDREKVVESIIHAFNVMIGELDGCSFFDTEKAIREKNDAIELLKEQERIIEQYKTADSFLAAHGWKWGGQDA